jgi:hypothetical protein
VNGSARHLSLAELLDYWLHDSDPAATEAADEHLMRCDACGEQLDALIALGDGVRAAFRAGAVSAVSTGAFVQHLRAAGLRLREYRLPRNGSVHCTVAPGDELLVSTLEAPLQGVQRLDAVAESSIEPGVQHRLDDVPFDPAAGVVLHLAKIAQVRQLPAHTLRVTLLSVAPAGPRVLGHYTFHHRPWQEQGESLTPPDS